MKLADVEFSTRFDGSQWVTHIFVGNCFWHQVHGETAVSAMIAAEIAVRKSPRFTET